MCWFMSVECLICGLLYSSFVSGCVCSCCMVCYMFLLVVSGVMLCVVIYGVLLIDRIILCIYIGVCGELVSVFGLLNYGELMVLCVMCMFMWLSCVRCVVSDLLCVSQLCWLSVQLGCGVLCQLVWVLLNCMCVFMWCVIVVVCWFVL